MGLAISPAWAQPAPTELAEVISVVPILVQEAVPQEDCIDLPQQRQRCRTTTVQQEVAQGYEVTYEYRGRRFTTELPYDPGPTVVVQPPRATHQYSSQPNHETVHPRAQKLWLCPGGWAHREHRVPQPPARHPHRAGFAHRAHHRPRHHTRPTPQTLGNGPRRRHPSGQPWPKMPG